jgi:hypothetical protein
MTDEEVLGPAATKGRWLRAFPRSRKSPGPLIDAIHAWLTVGPPPAPLTEDWLLHPGT